MKRIFAPCVLFIALFAYAQFGYAGNLVYFVDLNAFYDAEGKPYVEIGLDINAGSVQFEKAKQGFQGGVEVKIEISPKENEAAPVYSRSFDLFSPVIDDTSNRAFGILDIKRVSLAPGNYVLIGTLRDKLSGESKQFKFSKEFFLDAQLTDKLSYSDILFVQSVTPSKVVQAHSKHGYDIIPYVNNGNFIDADSLKFYFETYHSELQSPAVYFTSVFLTEANSTTKLRNFQRTFRQNVRPLDIVMGAFDITKLPSGVYFLNVQSYSQTQDSIGSTIKKIYLVNSKTDYQAPVSNELFTDQFSLTEEQLDYYIHTLYYISTPNETDFAKSLQTYAEKQNYFYHFWDKRKEKPTDLPSKPWVLYKSRVDYANTHFKAAHLKGWRTELGRVLLTFGTPNDIEYVPSSNNKHPYEVWRYNKLKTQANVRFIFFSPNQATNDYVLLHSDLRGERNNPRWEFELARTTNNANLDVDGVNGRRSGQGSSDAGGR
jgi:GWxTD domain-containing protein